MALVRRLVQHNSIAIRIARSTSNIRRAFQMMRIDIDGPYRPVRRDHHARPTEGAVERLIAADHKSLEALRIICRDVRVQRALGIHGREHVVGAAVVTADRIQQMHAGTMIARRTAPARVRQGTAKRVKRVAAIK